MNRFKLTLLVLLFNPLLIGSSAQGIVYSIIDYVKDEEGLFFRLSGSKKTVYYFPSKTINFTTYPQNPTAKSAIVDISIILSDIEVSSIQKKNRHWKTALLQPAQLKMINNCEIPKSTEHIRGIRLVHSQYKQQIEGRPGTILCNARLWIEKDRQDQVKTQLTNLLTENKIMSDLFSVKLNIEDEVILLKWENIRFKLNSLIDEEHLLKKDEVIFHLGMAMSDEYPFLDWWDSSTKKDRDRFLNESMTILWNREADLFHLKQKSIDGNFSNGNSKSVTINF